jgi:hypothetical protein
MTELIDQSHEADERTQITEERRRPLFSCSSTMYSAIRAMRRCQNRLQDTVLISVLVKPSDNREAVPERHHRGVGCSPARDPVSLEERQRA